MDLPLNPEFPYYLAESDFAELGGQFQNESGIDWTRFLFFGEETTIHAGDHLIHQFDCDSNIYVLTHGELEVRVASARGGPEHSIATVEPIAVIGEQSFLDDGPRTASVIAKTRSTAYRLTQAAFEEMRAEEPRVAWAFLLDIARSLSRRSRSRLDRQAGL
jgi:CRP/FNR family cyclic AMP-dependent transcriptional regulator